MHYSAESTISEIIRSLRDVYPAGESLYLTFGDCTIKVLATESQIIDELKAYFGPFVSEEGPHQLEISCHEATAPTFDKPFTVKSPDPGKSKIKEEYLDVKAGRVVNKRLTEMMFLFGEGYNLAIGPCMENLNQVVNFINNRFIEWDLCQGSLLGHAAAVIWKEKGIAIAGFSGAGKSTLALHLMSKGTHFVSNDRLMVSLEDGQLMMRGVAKLPRINPGTILNNDDLISILTEEEQEEFSALPPEELWQLEYKFDVPIESCFRDARFLLKAPMHLLVLLNWKRGEGVLFIKQVDLNERRDLLPAFMKSKGLFFMPFTDCQVNEATDEDYINVLKHSQVIEMSGSIDFDKATDAILYFIETGSLGSYAS